jgi:hypothetical protein
LLAVSLLLGSATAGPIENVFVVVIDGLRNMEGFEAPQWHSDTMYLQHIWNNLRPQGTINTRFWNRGWTATTGGHTTILSGVRQILLNNGGNPQEVRSTDPLMFEYYRKQFAAPESACGVVVGKWGNVGDIANYGLEPSFGEPYKGFQRGDTSTGADSLCARLVHGAMDSLHPRLVLVNLGDVDHYGHTDTWEKYVRAIRAADSTVYEFWKHIQAEPPYTDTFYRNRTALIVVNDHGRHDNAHGGFKGHANWDHGSRHVMFLALGPGIAPNRVVDNIPRDQIDIVPTVAQMLGFPAPFAEGSVMSELFSAGAPGTLSGPGGPPIPFALNLSNNSGFSRDPDIARDRNGNLYCVWSDNTPGHWTVQYRKSLDNGSGWTAPRTLFDYNGADSTMWYARVAADDSVAVSATGFAKVSNWLDSARTRLDTTFVWYPWIATSADAGNNWGVKSLHDSSMGTNYAPVTVRNGRYSTAWWATGKFSIDTLNSGMLFNNRSGGGNWRSLPVGINKNHSIHVAAADGGSAYHVAASVWQTKDWDLIYYRSTNGDSWKVINVAKDPSGRATYDYDPELVVDDTGMVHLVWARKPNLGGAWQIVYGRLTSQTDTTWDTTRLTTSSAGAWQPHISAKGCTLALVWIDYRDGNPELYCQFSANRGLTWTLPERITHTSALTHHPRVAPLAQGFYVVWQDMNSGNWDVYGRQISFPVGRDCGVVQINSPAGSLDSTMLVTPAANFRNYGATTASFPAYFQIKDSLGSSVYLETTAVTDIAAGETRTASFPVWPKPYGLGRYSTWCWFGYLGDTNTHNDTLGGSFTVTPPPPAWHAKAGYPVGPRSKNVKDGCGLAYTERSDTGYIYSLKGNGTCEFYAYNVGSDFWLTRESIPAYNLLGKKKGVKKGATIAGLTGRAYAAKGNGTLDWWEYDPARVGSYPWQQKNDVPAGAKTLKEGAGSATVTIGDTTYVYLLKGTNTFEFYRYNTANGIWQTMAGAPPGTSGKGFRNGSCVTYDGSNLIYALKASYNEFYGYRLDSNLWFSKASLPLTGSAGRKKKVKDGAGLAFHGRVVYALKGGNTNEFWKYYADSDRWVQLEDVPLSAGRRVKGGGALVHAAANNALYATKGNNTLEFYNYYPLADIQLPMPSARPQAQGMPQSALGTPQLTVSPSIFRAPNSPVRIYFSLPQSGNATLKLYDVSGQVVATLVAGYQTAGDHSLILGHSRPARGVYMLKLSADDATLTRKLIIE